MVAKTSTTFDPDNLVAGEDAITRSGTLLSGEGALLRGTVLGAVLLGAVTQGFVGTGNGVLTMDVSTPILANAIDGAYTVKCITAAANGGTFRVFDPKGRSLGDVAVAATFANQIKFSIADGSSDFVVGDVFTLTVAIGSKKWRKSLTAAVDGSQYPSAILALDCDSTAADKACEIYEAGEFNSGALIYGTGHSLTTVRDPLRALGIHLKTIVA